MLTFSQLLAKQKLDRANNHQYQAHKAIGGAVQAGRMPKASTLSCADCGRKGAHYHHDKGYEPEYYFQVIVVCHSCHYKRHRSSRTGKFVGER